MLKHNNNNVVVICFYAPLPHIIIIILVCQNQITLDCPSTLIPPYPSYHGNHSPDRRRGQQMVTMRLMVMTSSDSGQDYRTEKVEKGKRKFKN